MKSKHLSLVALLCAPLFSPTSQSAAANPQLTQTECLGYYSLDLPGAIEYATVPINRIGDSLDGGVGFRFSPAMYARQTHLKVSAGNLTSENEGTSIYVSALAKAEDLQNLMEKKNKEQQAKKDDFNRKAALFGKDERLHQVLLQDAAHVSFYQLFNTGKAFGASVFEGKKHPTSVEHEERFHVHFDLYALIGDRIVRTQRKPLATPEKTLEEFLKHYRPRAPFEIPNEPGACLPYAFVRGEYAPAFVAASIRLVDQPDIVIYLNARDASQGREDPGKFVNANAQGSYYFAGARYTEPLDGDLRPIRSVVIDGRKGKGGFARITREVETGPDAANNPATNNQDWGYLAYIPGTPGGKPGESFNLVFKVERFGRFAKQPMTEREFRQLVKTLAAGIRRRPGAWQAP